MRDRVFFSAGAPADSYTFRIDSGTITKITVVYVGVVAVAVSPHVL